jgi:hypothetical protein
MAPRTPLEEMLVGVWSELLDVEPVGVRDSFFELGGHSLLATRMLSRVRHDLRVEVPVPCFFGSPTVAGLALEIVRVGSEGTDPSAVDQMLAELEGLSEDRVRALLWQSASATTWREK